MKHEINQIIVKPHIQDLVTLNNYTHFRIVKGGVILSSNKNFKIDRIFLPNEHINFISFN